MTITLPAFPDKLASKLETALCPSSDQQDIRNMQEIPGDNGREIRPVPLLSLLSQVPLWELRWQQLFFDHENDLRILRKPVLLSVNETNIDLQTF